MQKRFAGVHRNGRASRDRAVLECLSGIEFRLACSVPYLADLLDSEGRTSCWARWPTSDDGSSLR